MMQTILIAVLTAAQAYLLGSVDTGILVSKYLYHDDVRNHGSGAAGMTNMLRTFGKKAAALTAFGDVLKGVLAVCIGRWLFTLMPESTTISPYLAVYLAAIFAIIGHLKPLYFGFKGGKGILSGGTLVWLLDWRVGLIAWGLFAALWLLTKYVSLGSVCAAASMPVTTFFFCGRSLLYTALAVLIAALVIWCHRENITRLLHHQERKFQWHTGTPKEKE